MTPLFIASTCQNERSGTRPSRVNDESINCHRERSRSFNRFPMVTADVSELSPKLHFEQKLQTYQEEEYHKNFIQWDSENTISNNGSVSVESTNKFQNLLQEDLLARSSQILTHHDHEIYDDKIKSLSRSGSLSREESFQSDFQTSDETTSILNTDENVNGVGLNQNNCGCIRVYSDRTPFISLSDPIRHFSIKEISQSSSAEASRTSFENTECLGMRGGVTGCRNKQFNSNLPKMKETLHPFQSSERNALKPLHYNERKDVQEMVNEIEKKQL